MRLREIRRLRQNCKRTIDRAWLYSLGLREGLKAMLVIMRISGMADDEMRRTNDCHVQNLCSPPNIFSAERTRIKQKGAFFKRKELQRSEVS